MSFQDDSRENQLIQLFQLAQPSGRGRADVDAYLPLDGVEYPFELKSTSRGSVTTVRDFGPEHIAKWQDEHWLIGVFDRSGVNLQYVLYGSPQRMKPWIDEKAEYIAPDFALADLVPTQLTEEHMDAVLGYKATYSLEDARRLHKKQWTITEYRSQADLPGHKFSRGKMLKILRLRLEYIIKRGSTLNNPHIPESYFDGWDRITENHATRLRELVRAEL